ncbi:hypothetical protein NUITMVRA1_14470 [Aerococcus viridans]|nr:hypothetical protein NUITMVRA1_14470 [Aerococcus viridans]
MYDKLARLYGSLILAKIVSSASTVITCVFILFSPFLKRSINIQFPTLVFKQEKKSFTTKPPLSDFCCKGLPFVTSAYASCLRTKAISFFKYNKITFTKTVKVKVKVEKVIECCT